MSSRSSSIARRCDRSESCSSPTGAASPAGGTSPWSSVESSRAWIRRGSRYARHSAPSSSCCDRNDPDVGRGDRPGLLFEKDTCCSPFGSPLRAPELGSTRRAPRADPVGFLWYALRRRSCHPSSRRDGRDCRQRPVPPPPGHRPLSMLGAYVSVNVAATGTSARREGNRLQTAGTCDHDRAQQPAIIVSAQHGLMVLSC